MSIVSIFMIHRMNGRERRRKRKQERKRERGEERGRERVESMMMQERKITDENFFETRVELDWFASTQERFIDLLFLVLSSFHSSIPEGIHLILFSGSPSSCSWIFEFLNFRVLEFSSSRIL